MRFSKSMLAAAAAFSLAASPAMANPASSLSTVGASSVRATTATGKSNEVAGGFIIPAIAIIAIILGVVAVSSDGDPDSP